MEIEEEQIEAIQQFFNGRLNVHDSEGMYAITKILDILDIVIPGIND